jgi:trans-aconitate methyltransferase
MEIRDPGMRVRFMDLPDIIHDWLSPHLPLEGARILDFGCGEGVTALGMAVRYRPNLMLGCDISAEVHHCADIAGTHFGLKETPANLRLMHVEPGSLIPEAVDMDMVYAWSVFEHVSQDILGNTLDLLHGCLRDGGYLFIQIAPLFYSSQGSHMQEKVPEPWAHLSMQHNLFMHRLSLACSNAAEYHRLAGTYLTLNRITVPTLLDAISSAGFERVRTYTTKEDLKPSASLLTAYREEVLCTNQVAVLARKRRR